MTDSKTHIVAAHWDAERREFEVGSGFYVTRYTDSCLDDLRYDIDHMVASITGSFRDPSFAHVREQLLPGYEAMQVARAGLRARAIGSAIYDLTGLSTNDGDEAVFERLLADKGYRILRAAA